MEADSAREVTGLAGRDTSLVGFVATTLIATSTRF